MAKFHLKKHSRVLQADRIRLWIRYDLNDLNGGNVEDGRSSPPLGEGRRTALRPSGQKEASVARCEGTPVDAVGSQRQEGVRGAPCCEGEEQGQGQDARDRRAVSVWPGREPFLRSLLQALPRGQAEGRDATKVARNAVFRVRQGPGAVPGDDGRFGSQTTPPSSPPPPPISSGD